MLKRGDFVGPYEIRDLLGQGGMGHVYEAFDPRLERTVALKVIATPESGEILPNAAIEEFSVRLLREARAVASLNHPNVVSIYDVGESGGRLYLAMESIVGATLRQLAANADTPLSQRLQWLTDVARALFAAHQAGLVHRDVKPENVMVREDGIVKVLDFGIARRTLTATEDAGTRLDTVTGSHTITGTPVYMSPEQIKGRVVDARSDQFAWGVMAYELVTGQRPWDDSGDVLSVVARVLTETPTPIRERAPHVPQPVEDTILRALSKEPAARFASMANVADVLEPFASSSSVDRVRITPRSTSEHPTQVANAFAATTRIALGVEVGTARQDPSLLAREAPVETRRPRKFVQLLVPLVLLGALSSIVVSVTKHTAPTTSQALPTRSSSSQVPEAEAAYKEAAHLWRDGSAAKSRAALRRAVELDAMFAAAHLELAIQTMPTDPIGAQAAFQLAFEHRQRLTPRDTALLDAAEPYIHPKPDIDAWETRLAALTFQFPRDAELQLLLGLARAEQGEITEAIKAFETARKLDAGFVPALAALADAQHDRGRDADALATTEQCLNQSPVATICLESRVRMYNESGQCHLAREEAATWRAVDPTSVEALHAFARGLFSDGAPRPSVEEALGRAWAVAPAAEGPTLARWDRMLLAIADGHFAKADDLAREIESQLPADADQFEHARIARTRIENLRESNRLTEAAKVARDFLDRMDAWTPRPLAYDPSFAFYETLFRAGELSKADLERHRSLQPANALSVWEHWAATASMVETDSEATDALSRMPGNPLSPNDRRNALLAFAIGKAYVLAGEPRKALPSLRMVTESCLSLDNAGLIHRARLYLGMAYEATGEFENAKTEYARVIQSWPTEASRTAKTAADRRDALK